MFCASCGAPVEEGASYCLKCGARQSFPGDVPAAAPGGTPVGSPASPPWAAPAAAYPAAFAGGYASWGSRAIGFIVDNLLVGAVMAVLYVVLAGVMSGIAGLAGHNAAAGVCCSFLVLFPLATLLAGIYNGVYLVAQRGYSIGQGLVHVKVVDAAGDLLSQGTAFLRLLVRAAMGFIPFLPVLDLLWPLWDARGQTLHDKAVNCYVVNNPQGV
jgi:uncharacterized RDD family membrane protein YckC